MIFKKLLNLGKRKESKSESSKSPRKGFGSKGYKYAKIYARGDTLFFVGGGEFGDGKAKGMITAHYPFFKLPKSASAEEKGRAVRELLEEFIVGIEYGARPKYFHDKELLKLSGLKNINSFYRNARLCSFTLEKGSDVVKFTPYKRESGGQYRGIDGFDIQAPADDPEALGRALDECLDKAI